MIDPKDAAILRRLQQDAALTIDALADAVHLSRNACLRTVASSEGGWRCSMLQNSIWV
jgi:Lrp/AsnC family transcriptional regulator